MGAWQTLAELEAGAGLDLNVKRDELVDGLGSTYSLADLRGMSFEALCVFKAAGRFPDPYPVDVATWNSPRDPGGHAVLAWVMLQATHTLAINMYGFDDDLLAAILAMKASDPAVTIVVNLDKSQAGGVHEKVILAALSSELPGNLIAVGNSEQHAISHLKYMVADGYRVSGSMNWSMSGESKQDNELTVARIPALATEALAVILKDHSVMHAQAAPAA
jgi:hypothetical protein